MQHLKNRRNRGKKAKLMGGGFLNSFLKAQIELIITDCRGRNYNWKTQKAKELDSIIVDLVNEAHRNLVRYSWLLEC